MRNFISTITLLLTLMMMTGSKESGFDDIPDAGRMKLSAISSMVKVPMKLNVALEVQDTVQISAAGGEYEAFQVVVSSAENTKLTGIRWSVSALKTATGEIGMNNITVNPVGYIQTTVLGQGYPSTLGWYPDPLLVMDTLSIAAGERQPLWVTVYVPRGTPAGTYTGHVHVESDNAGSSDIPVTLRVWGFEIPLTPSIKTMTWVNDISMRNFGGDTRENRKAYYELLLKHRLGPGGGVELDEEMLGFCIERGLNAFILDNIPNLKRLNQNSYTDAYKESLRARLSNYVDRFGPRGWLNGMAYVFNYDEVPQSHWYLAKEMYSFVKSVSPDLKVLQCLENPAGVAALAGYADTWDIYVAQFEQSGVKNRVEQGDEAWLAICCWPSVRPNLFLEYPAIDGRILGWICFQTGVTGFEYWSPNQWTGNFAPPTLRGGWKANTFNNYNGDGYLTYPGPNNIHLSSLRFANFRDGFEDFEYLNLLKSLGDNTNLIQQVVSGPTIYSSDPKLLYQVRENAAKRIEELISIHTNNPTDTCITSSSTCQNLSFESQTGTFETTFSVTPLNGQPLDVVAGLSDGQANSAADMSCIIRVSLENKIIGRNGSSWSWNPYMDYSANTKYIFRFVVNVAANTYNIYVSPEGGSEVPIGTNYAFRVPASSLAYWSIVDVENRGTVKACDFKISGLTHTPDMMQYPNGMNLSSFPNPTSDEVTIQYRLREPGNVTLSLFDISGKQIAIVESGYKEMGIHEKKYHLTALPNDVYFIRLIHHGRFDSCKLLKLGK